MIGIDTNVLVRYLVKDDLDQFLAVKSFFSQCTMQNPAFVSLLVTVEVVWVLQKQYGYKNAVIKSCLASMMQTSELVFEDSDFVADLVCDASSLRFDIADHLISHIALKNGCTHTVTFDKHAAKSVPGMELLA